MPCDWYMPNFLHCVRSRKQTHINADVGYRVAVGIDLANKAFRENKAMLFDPASQQVIS